jgi:hypothetical protein
MTSWVVLFIVFCVVTANGFRINLNPSLISRRQHTDMKMVKSTANYLGLIPICLEASSTSTTQDDPTAGMSPDEIVNYVSNVGGGLCGYPEGVKTAVGLTLNLSLLTFGVLTLGYIILGAWNFALEKSVDESIKKIPGGEKLLEAVSKPEDTRQGQLFNTAQTTSFSSSAAFEMDPLTASQQVVSPNDERIKDAAASSSPGYVQKGDSVDGGVGDFTNDGMSPQGQSRSERRLKNRLKRGEK